MTDEKRESPTRSIAESHVAARYFGSFTEDYHSAFVGQGKARLHRLINRLFRRKTFQRRTADVEAVLSRYGIAGKRVLDIGCGSGEVALVCARLGAIVHGIDIVPGMVDIASREAKLAGLDQRTSFAVMNIMDQALPSADITLAVGVIEYYSDLPDLIARIVGATGELAVIVDTRGPWWRRALRLALARLKSFNLHYHDPELVRRLLRDHGFREYALIVGHSYTLFAANRDVARK